MSQLQPQYNYYVALSRTSNGRTLQFRAMPIQLVIFQQSKQCGYNSVSRGLLTLMNIRSGVAKNITQGRSLRHRASVSSNPLPHPPGLYFNDYASSLSPVVQKCSRLPVSGANRRQKSCVLFLCDCSGRQRQREQQLQRRWRKRICMAPGNASVVAVLCTGSFMRALRMTR